MDYSLQLLGSLASVFSIPLGIYFFLRSREMQFRRLREEIARNLSYQIGDGRKLSSFEIQAVIDSQSRQNRVPKNRISSNDVIEDLVTDTIRNPMIPSVRKQEIINNLRDVYTQSFFIADLHPVGPKRTEEDKAADSTQVADLEMHRDVGRHVRQKLFVIEKLFVKDSSLFLGILLTFSVVLFGAAFLSPTVYHYPDRWSSGTQIVLGVLASLILSGISAAIVFCIEYFSAPSD